MKSMLETQLQYFVYSPKVATDILIEKATHEKDVQPIVPRVFNWLEDIPHASITKHKVSVVVQPCRLFQFLENRLGDRPKLASKSVEEAKHAIICFEI